MIDLLKEQLSNDSLLLSYGAISGYLGGRVDNFMMRLVDVLYSIPFIFVVIFLITILNEPSIKDSIRDWGIDQITVRTPLPLSSGVRQFMRLRVEEK